MNEKIVSSDIEQFKKQLENPDEQVSDSERIFDTPFDTKSNIQKVTKNVILSISSDYGGCGHIRNFLIMNVINAVFGKKRKLHAIITPFFTNQTDILARTRTIFFQRTMTPRLIPTVRKYREVKDKLKYKMVYDIDDFIYDGEDVDECIPEYNFGRHKIDDSVRKANIECMNLMDTVCVSTEFLGNYIKKKLKIEPEIAIVPNTVPQYFWGNQYRHNIKEKIEKPRIVYTGSPTHYCNRTKQLGDWNNAWKDYIIKNVKEDKIEFTCMGGLPWFFEEIKDKIRIIEWLHTYKYHLPLLDIRPHFSIGPLVPNYFNYSKSDIKAIEAYACGSIFIGSVFSNGKPSPYDNCFVTIKDSECTVDNIEKLISDCSEPEKFNSIIDSQFNYMIDDGRYTESPKFINNLLKII
ncbi:MAG: hypothetical protein ACOC2U_03830 [bacterium]